MVVRMRQDRLKEIQADKGPKGPGRDMDNIEYWQNRASQNSQIAPRASGDPSTNGATRPNLDPPKEHDTGRRMNLRDSSMKPMARRSIDARMVAKADHNDVGSSFMKSVRRGES